MTDHVHMSPGYFSIGEVIAYFFLFFLGLIGNLVVIFTLIGNYQTLKRSANIYILNLTIADILLIISIPNTIFGPDLHKLISYYLYRNFRNLRKLKRSWKVPQFQSLNEEIEKLPVQLCNHTVKIPLFGLPEKIIEDDFWVKTNFDSEVCHVTASEISVMNSALVNHYAKMIHSGRWKKLMVSINFISFFASVVFLVMMSLDRFLLIVTNHPKLRERYKFYIQELSSFLILLYQ